jgi:endo-beta-N-acetylglucosaminidase D
MTKKMLTAVVCLGAAVASAQTMQSTVRVSFDHDTQVGKVSLPAGKYSIKELNNSVIEISSADRNGANVFATVIPVEQKNGAPSDQTKVVLKQDDNGTYALQSIWLEGQEFGFELE